MQYFKDKDLQIRAGLAKNIKLLLEQYDSFNLKEIEKYDVTLLICCLQTLLTNYLEILNDIQIPQKSSFNLNKPIKIIGNNFGITNDTLLFKNEEYEIGKIYEDFHLTEIFKILRNSLSHPTKYENDLYPSTGYITICNDKNSSSITHIVFIESPHVKYQNGGKKLKEGRKLKFIKIQLSISQIKLLVLKLSGLMSLPHEFHGDENSLEFEIQKLVA